MKRSAIRGCAITAPDSTSFHPGYNRDIKPGCFRYNARLSKFET